MDVLMDGWKQVLRNYHRERERITKESHSEFKARREQLREIIATSKPLFRFYRDLLQVNNHHMSPYLHTASHAYLM